MGIRARYWRATEKKEDPDTMPKNHRKDRGSKHDVREPLKKKSIWARCRRAAEKKKDPDMM